MIHFGVKCINNENQCEEITLHKKYEVEQEYEDRQYLIHTDDGFEKFYNKKYFEKL